MNERRLTVWKVMVAGILAAGLYATVYRFSQGLGAATNLSDEFPWGLWIGFDVLVGVGLAAGGFVVAATVHIFGLKRYASIARPTILTAFLGYLLVIVALMFDLGRPYRIWHALVMWNPHSVMFEVAWCVMLYTTVLFLEFSPLIWERLGMQRLLRFTHAITVPLVIVGVLLSFMHQSSLGTLYVIVPDKLHGLWYTPMLPVFFLITAIAAGLAMTIFESCLSFRAFGKSLEAGLLRNLGRVIVVVLAVYAVWKVEDLAMRGRLGLAFQATPEAVLFWGEMGLGVLLPMLLFATPAVRATSHGLFFASVLTVMGFVVGRLNVAVTGMAASSGVTYFPSWMEVLVTMSVVALGFVLFRLAVKHLPVFPVETVPPERPERPVPRLILQPRLLAILWALFLLGFVSVAYSVRRAENGESPAVPAAAVETSVHVPLTRLPDGLELPRGDDSPGAVVFYHETHVDPDRPDCTGCHRSTFSILKHRETSGQPGTSYHDSCGSCHDGQAAFALDEDCGFCHQS